MFVCNYNRKTFVVDHTQKYVEIANDCLWIEISDERLRFLQTKHLQCRAVGTGGTGVQLHPLFFVNMTMIYFWHGNKYMKNGILHPLILAPCNGPENKNKLWIFSSLVQIIIIWPKSEWHKNHPFFMKSLNLI